MGLSEMPHPTILSRKRCRSEDAFSFTDPSPPQKQPWLETLPAPHCQSHHLSYLEELESSLDASTLESPTPEDLVAEMMRSLESVIVDMEELSAVSETLVEKALILETEALATLPEMYIREAEVSVSDSDTVVAELSSETLDLEPSVRASPVLPCADLITVSSYSHTYETEQNSEAEVCSHAGVDIRHLLDVSDDELGIPAPSILGNEVLTEVSNDDWSLLDESSADSAGVNNASQDGGMYAQIMGGGWLDNDCGLGHGESMADFARELCGMIMLDGYL